MRLIIKFYFFIILIGFSDLQAQNIKSNDENKELQKSKLVSVIIGSFKNQNNAVNLKQKLEKKGFSNTKIQEIKNGFYRVSIGTFFDLNSARQFVRENGW